MEELKVRLMALIRRAQGGVSTLAANGISVDLNTHQATRDGKPLKLSPVCWRMLVTLVRNSPNVVTRAKLEEAWEDEFPTPDSFKAQLFKLRKVVDAPFDSKLIHTVHGVGVALRKEES